MTTPTLTERRPPWVVITRADDPWVGAEVAALEAGRGSVIRLDGRELLEFGFPGYFGHNWHALIDCLHDWHGHGLPTRDIAVLIEHADALLGTDFLGLFVAALCDAAWNANLQLDADGVPHANWPPFTQHFVLLLDTTGPEAFLEPAGSHRDTTAVLSEGRVLATDIEAG